MKQKTTIRHYLTIIAIAATSLFTTACVTDADYYGYNPPVNVRAGAYQDAYREYTVVPYLAYNYNAYNYGGYGYGTRAWAQPRPWGGRPWAGGRYESFRAHRAHNVGRGNPSCRR